jgi:hypothetical protein
MSVATAGALIESDAPLIQFIKHFDEQQQRKSGQHSFIISRLDDRNILVKEEAVQKIQEKVDEHLASNAFTRADEAPPEEQRRRRERAPQDDEAPAQRRRKK